MKIVSTDALRTAVGEINVADVNALLSSALDLVTTPIEVMLVDRFEYGVFHDVFLDNYIDPVITQVPYTLVLSSGFIHSANGLKVFVASTIDELATVSECTLSKDVDYSLGLVRFLNGRPGLYIRVEYTAGLSSAMLDDTEDYIEEEPLPLWLKQVTIAYASTVYQRLVWMRSQSEESNSKSKEPKVDLLSVPSSCVQMAAKHIRWFPTGLKPTYTVKQP